MTTVELLVILLLLAMAVPDLCRWLGRPALAYPAFVCFGIAVGPLLRPEVGGLLMQAGQIGFALLLFEVGLEIDLQPARELRRPGAWLLRWLLWQYPVLLALARLAGLPWLESFVAAAALGACSAGMVHAAWKAYPGLDGASRPFLLQVIVLLEVVAVVLLAVETTVLGRAPGWWFGLKLAGIGLAIYACSRGAVPMARLLQTILERTTHWRLHLVTLLVLAACAAGERLGLSGPKTAFFLGLFSSRVRHDGRNLEEYLAPISRRFLIPLFFLALGTQVPPAALWSRMTLLAMSAGALLIAFRRLLYQRLPRPGGDTDAYLLLCPNFTIVALAAEAMLSSSAAGPAAAHWLLVAGLFVTIVPLLALPGTARAPRP